MKFYHGTTEENWKKIQKEGVLWGKCGIFRYTYLTPDIRVAAGYGSDEVILEVEYKPVGRGVDNYELNLPFGEICWEFAVRVPISIDKVKRINYEYKYEGVCR